MRVFAWHAPARTAPDRGMRFQRITAALGAVEADAGMCLAGLALILEKLGAGGVELPYPVATGQWSGHAFAARYRSDSRLRPHIARFRAWLAEEAGRTHSALARFTG